MPDKSMEHQEALAMDAALHQARAASSLSEMLGNGAHTDREKGISVKAFIAGCAHGRMQVATGGDPIAPDLLKELSSLHILIDWSGSEGERDRIGVLIAKARGKSLLNEA